MYILVYLCIYKSLSATVTGPLSTTPRDDFQNHPTSLGWGRRHGGVLRCKGSQGHFKGYYKGFPLKGTIRVPRVPLKGTNYKGSQGSFKGDYKGSFNEDYKGSSKGDYKNSFKGGVPLRDLEGFQGLGFDMASLSPDPQEDRVQVLGVDPLRYPSVVQGPKLRDLLFGSFRRSGQSRRRYLPEFRH